MSWLTQPAAAGFPKQLDNVPDTATDQPLRAAASHPDVVLSEFVASSAKEYRRAARDDVAVLNVEERAEIRRLHRAEGMTIRAIAACIRPRRVSAVGDGA